jgi:hypothetical protein
MNQGSGVSIIILFSAGIVMFAVSLFIQLGLSGRAKEMVSSDDIMKRRPVRRIERNRRAETVKTGRVQKEPAPRASKILIGKK